MLRARILALGGCLAISTMLTGLAAADSELLVVTWGGAYTDAQKVAIFEPYMKANPGVHIKVEDLSAQALSQLKAQAETGNTTWDVIDVTVGDEIIACQQGLLLEYDADQNFAPGANGEKPSEDFLEGSLGAGGMKCLAPLIKGNLMFAYDPSAFNGKKPTSVADVFDLVGFPGKRGLEKSPVYNLEWALVADGVAPDKIYETLASDEGLERAFKKLDTIKPEIVWWSAGAQPPQLLADGEVVFSSGYVTRFFNAIEAEKKGLALLWDHQILDTAGWVIPSGSKNIEQAKAFVKYASSPEAMVAFSSNLPLGPARKSVIPLIGKHATLGVDMVPYLPTNPAYESTSLVLDPVWWADHRDDIEEKFQAWLSK